jgi:hypothetical protein
MLWWLPRRRARIIQIDAEAESLISDLGALAYDEARRRETEASSDAIARDWHRVAQAIARKTGAGLGTSVQAPPKAEFAPAPESGAPKETPPGSELGPLDQLNSTVAVTPPQFRVQFIRTADWSQPLTLKEVGLEAADMPAAIVAAASLTFPPMTNGLRIIDREGRVVFARQKKKTGRSLRLVS